MAELDERQQALLLFNRRLADQQEAERAERRVKKAERAKNDAASALKKLRDANAPSDEIAAADDAWRHAIAVWEARKAGDPDPAKPGAQTESSDGSKAESSSSGDAGDEPSADEAAPAEASGDDSGDTPPDTDS